MDAPRIMAVCERCAGDGVMRVPNKGCDPMLNVHGLQLVNEVWIGACRRCGGAGILEWTRGISLTPLISLKNKPPA